MCLWNKMPKITIPSMTPAQLQQTNNTAQNPENAVMVEQRIGK